MEGAKIHDERDRNRGLRGAVRTLGGAAYSSQAAPTVSTKAHTTGTRARGPTRSCTCAKALTETHPGVRDWLSATRICMQSKLGTPSWPLFLATPHTRRCRLLIGAALFPPKQRPREAKERLSSFTRASHKSPWFLCKSTAKPEPGTSWRTVYMTDDQGLLR